MFRFDISITFKVQLVALNSSCTCATWVSKYLTQQGQVAAAWNDDKKSLVILNSFIQVVEIGETKIIRIFKSKKKHSVSKDNQ